MKKLAITLTAAVLFFTAGAFAANKDEIPGKVQTAFQKDFFNAQSVTWQKSDNLYFANFSWNTSDIKAVFNSDGELLNTSRKVSIAELPLKITMAIEKKYKGYKIHDNAVEIIADDQTQYRVVISNDKEEITLTSDAGGSFGTENKQ